MRNRFLSLPRIITAFTEMLITWLPGIPGNTARRLYWRNKLRFIGTGARIDVGVYIQNPEYVSLDENCWLDRGVIILAGPDQSQRERRYVENADFPLNAGEVRIGRNVHIAPGCLISGIGGVFISDNCGVAAGCKIFSFSNHYRSDSCPSDREILFAIGVPDNRQFMIEGPVFLGSNVGLGANAVLLPGSSIGDDSFININSVVSGAFPVNSLISGNPAERRGERFRGNKKQ